MYTYHSFFTSSSTDGHLGRLQILAIVSNAAVAHVFFQTDASGLDTSPEAESRGHEAVAAKTASPAGTVVGTLPAASQTTALG